MFKLPPFLVSLVLIITVSSVSNEKSHAQEATNTPPDHKVVVYFNHVDGYAYLNEKGVIVGEVAELVQAFLSHKGVSYEMRMGPWRTARQAVTTPPREKNSLIVFLDRNDKTEDDYNWILPVFSVSTHLLTRNEPELYNLSKEEIIEGGYKATCFKPSTRCERLAEFGFDEQNILISPAIGVNPAPLLVLNKRAEFWIGNLQLTKANLKKENLDPSMVSKALTLSHETVNYLAAGKGFDPELLKLLTSKNDEVRNPSFGTPIRMK